MRDFPLSFPPHVGPMMGCGRSFGPGFGAFDGAQRAQMRGPFPPPPFGNYGSFPHMEWNHEHIDHNETHHHGPRRHDEHHGFHEDGCRYRSGTQKPGLNRRHFGSFHHGRRTCRHEVNEENPQEIQFDHHEEEFDHFRPRMWPRIGPGHHGPWRRHEFREGLLSGPSYWRGTIGPRGHVNHQSRNARCECCCDQSRCRGRTNYCENAGITRRCTSPSRDRSEGRGQRKRNTRSPCEENQETVLVQKIVVDKNPRCYSV